MTVADGCCWPPPGNPGPAWWILAAGGAVLAVVDAQTHLLPARFTYPLAAAVGCALVIGSITGGDAAALLRAAAAAARIGAIMVRRSGSSRRPRWAWVTSGSPR